MPLCKGRVRSAGLLPVRAVGSAKTCIARSLYVLSEQTENKKLRDTIEAVRKDVEAGLALSEAFDKHPKVFSRLYIEMVRTGEIGGILDAVLLRIADQLENDQELRRKVKSAMT